MIDEKDADVKDAEDKDTVEETKDETKSEVVNLEEMAGVDLDINLEGVEVKKDETETEEVSKETEKAKVIEPTEKEKEVTELKSRLDRLEGDKRDLKKALHEARQEKKKSKDPETVLTDAELQKIVEEHRDDPKVMFNAVTYKMQQMQKAGKIEAVNEVEIKSKQKDLNNILKDRIKDIDDEGSETRGIVNRAKTDFNLEDHPFGDFLGAAAAVYVDLPNLAKNWFEEGKKAGLSGKADENRVKGIKGSQLIPGGKKASLNKNESELTADQLDTAKRLGLANDPAKLKLYRSQILKQSGTNA